MAYRDEYYDEQTEDKNKMELIVRKQRNGKT
jgi:replicative DNA helicase